MPLAQDHKVVLAFPLDGCDPRFGKGVQYLGVLYFSSARQVLYFCTVVSIGRLLLAGGSFNYVGHNTSRDMASQSDQAEMILFHEAGGGYHLRVAKNAATMLTVDPNARGMRYRQDVKGWFRNNWKDGSRIEDLGFVYVAQGAGLGQWRRIASWTPTTITVRRPWRVPPDASSSVDVSCEGETPREGSRRDRGPGRLTAR